MIEEKYLKNLAKIKYWGAATSAHQVEGRNHNQWSVWELANAKQLADTSESKFADWLPSWNDIKVEAKDPNNYVSGVADDHYNRFGEDIELMKKLNLNAYRFSIEWSRIEPKQGQWDESEISHYQQKVNALIENNIEPVITLWHWTIPVWFAQQGGFEKTSNVKYFVRFCEKVVTKLKGQVKIIIVLNEPNIYTSISYFTGEWPPMEKSIHKTFRVYNNLAKAHKQAYKVLKSIDPNLTVGHTQHMTCAYPGDNSLISKQISWFRNFGWNWWFINKIKPKLDFIGINYYLSDRVYKTKVKNINDKQNDMGWDMDPVKIGITLKQTFSRYKIPILITENGLADREDKYRGWWINETLKGLSDAVEGGAKIIGYLHWSLLDNFEWDKGFWPRFGLIEVDRKTLKRTIRPSAIEFAKTIQIVRSRSENH